MFFFFPLEAAYGILKNFSFDKVIYGIIEGNWKLQDNWLSFEVKWSEVSYVAVLGDKSTMHIRVTLYWGYMIVLWLFYLVCILYCGCFNLFL